MIMMFERYGNTLRWLLIRPHLFSLPLIPKHSENHSWEIDRAWREYGTTLIHFLKFQEIKDTAYSYSFNTRYPYTLSTWGLI